MQTKGLSQKRSTTLFYVVFRVVVSVVNAPNIVVDGYTQKASVLYNIWKKKVMSRDRVKRPTNYKSDACLYRFMLVFLPFVY